MKTINLVGLKKGEYNALIPGSIGRGVIHTMEVKQGIFITAEDYILNEPVRFIYSKGLDSPREIGIGFCLSGYGISSPQCVKNPFKMVSGESNFFSFPAGIEFCETIKSNRMLGLTIMIEPDFITSCLDDFPDFFPEDLSFLLEGVHQSSNIISGAVQNLINQILSCPFQGIAGKFFLEGKVMEIIAHVLNENSYKYSFPRVDGIKPEDIQRVHKAAEIMKFSKDCFNNLDSIAKLVGMSRTRLYEYFRLVYGIPPGEYIRKFRIETAKSLLLNGKMGVGEVAYCVGYSNLSHFTRSFKKYEGVVPGAYKELFDNKLMNNCVI